MAARDRRFDGVFFVGVETTGVYCRPVCPARTPRRTRCVFFSSRAEAEREGFRACFRCRPELAPGNAPMDSVPRLVSSALARVEGGYLDERSVAELARELGITARHLDRALASALGVTPVELAQSRRIGLAKQLLQDTTLPMASVALGAGFSSVRRFNALFRERFGRRPSAVRRVHAAEPGSGIVLRLDYRPPFDWDALLEFLGPRAIAGVESVGGGSYRRTVAIGGHRGWIGVSHAAASSALRVELALSLAPVIASVVARVRSLFDLDAHPARIDARLSGSALLRPMVRARPGVRVPGAFDGFETALRAVLGQQVSVRGAATLAGRAASELGEKLATPFPELTRSGPSAAVLAGVDPASIARAVGLPLARAQAIQGLARAVAAGAVRLERGDVPAEAMAQLTALPGIGDWTAQYVAMRALGWPDAFPASDLGLRRALGVSRERAVLARAEAWRPWRAYAAMRLWLQGKARP
jgi:AraC family transcriptional regulator of adaptative response / DNA-3-methyladenine glycosylase II